MTLSLLAPTSYRANSPHTNQGLTYSYTACSKKVNPCRIFQIFKQAHRIL